MSFQINNLQTFELEECIKCGCTYAVTATFQKKRRDDRETFYCPNGHPQSYVKSTTESLRETVSLLTNAKNRLIEQVDEATARAEAAEAKLAKLTKRKK